MCGAIKEGVVVFACIHHWQHHGPFLVACSSHCVGWFLSRAVASIVDGGLSVSLGALLCRVLCKQLWWACVGHLLLLGRQSAYCRAYNILGTCSGRQAGVLVYCRRKHTASCTLCRLARCSYTVVTRATESCNRGRPDAPCDLSWPPHLLCQTRVSSGLICSGRGCMCVAIRLSLLGSLLLGSLQTKQNRQ